MVTTVVYPPQPPLLHISPEFSARSSPTMPPSKRRSKSPSTTTRALTTSPPTSAASGSTRCPNTTAYGSKPSASRRTGPSPTSSLASISSDDDIHGLLNRQEELPYSHQGNDEEGLCGALYASG